MCPFELLTDEKARYKFESNIYLTAIRDRMTTISQINPDLLKPLEKLLDETQKAIWHSQASVEIFHQWAEQLKEASGDLEKKGATTASITSLQDVLTRILTEAVQTT